MPIKSYLAHPYKYKKEELIKAISALEECEVFPAQNKDILVVVTDTSSKTDEDNLKNILESIPSLKLLAMVSGFNTSKQN